MYVAITLTEITGNERIQQMGQVSEDMPLHDLMMSCLEKADKFIPDGDRTDARHFWFNEKLIPFKDHIVRDLGGTMNVSVELRPDHYQVIMPKTGQGRFAIDPELTTAQVLDNLLGKKGASCCYYLVLNGKQILKDKETLYEQEALPYHGRLSQKETILTVRPKPNGKTTALATLLFLLGLGVSAGYFLAQIGK
jgi:hypothetical protein